MNKKIYRVFIWTKTRAIKEESAWVEASTKEEAIGLAYLHVTNGGRKPMFVRVVYVEEVRP